jgi:hypothetical protein
MSGVPWHDLARREQRIWMVGWISRALDDRERRRSTLHGRLLLWLLEKTT